MPIFLIIIIFIAAWIVVDTATVVTQPGEYRVIRQFGKIVRVDTSESNPYGLSFKIPFIHILITFIVNIID